MCQHRKSTLAKKILPPLLPGLELATFRSGVRRSTQLFFLPSMFIRLHLYLHFRLFLNRRGRWGTTDDFTTCFLHFSLFSTSLWYLANSRPVHSLMPSSHLLPHFAVAPHFHGSYSPLQLYCEDSWFKSIQEDGCEKGAHQSYLGTDRNAAVVPNWFQPCQCCYRLCYLGEYLRLGTLIRHS